MSVVALVEIEEINYYVTARARNILDPQYLFTQEYNPEGSNNNPFVFRSYRLGRTFTLGASFKL